MYSMATLDYNRELLNQDDPHTVLEGMNTDTQIAEIILGCLASNEQQRWSGADICEHAIIRPYISQLYDMNENNDLNN